MFSEYGNYLFIPDDDVEKLIKILFCTRSIFCRKYLSEINNYNFVCINCNHFNGFYAGLLTKNSLEAFLVHKTNEEKNNLLWSPLSLNNDKLFMLWQNECNIDINDPKRKQIIPISSTETSSFINLKLKNFKIHAQINNICSNNQRTSSMPVKFWNIGVYGDYAVVTKSIFLKLKTKPDNISKTGTKRPFNVYFVKQNKN